MANIGRAFFHLALLLPILIGTRLAMASDPASGDSTLVTAPIGRIQGKLGSGDREFLGVPYAAPPVGNLRWAPPQPEASLKTTLDATKLRSKCVQLSWAAPKTMQGNEDCLYLNIYVPSRPTAAGLPVMVWFHGGGWVAGSSQDVDPSVMAAREGIIVVTVNYRLGVFGFFASPALDAEDPSHKSGNYALRDEQAALRWIKRNISAFGGDPNRVTISGQSAGSISNWFHLVAPSSAALFGQMIAESGPVGLKSYNGEDSSRGVGGTKPINTEEQTGPSSRLFAALGCAGAAKPLACAREKSSKDILYAIDPNNARVAGWGVVVDGVLLPDAVPNLIRNGAYKRVPILTGFNVTEAGFGVLTRLANGGTTLSAKDYIAQVSAMPNGSRIPSAYPLGRYPSPDDAYIDMSSQASHCAMLVTASTVSAGGRLFMYEFNDSNPPPTLYFVAVPSNVHPGAFHTSEIAYVFQRGYPNELRPGLPPFTPAQLSLSSRMMHYWANFAKTGKPTAEGNWSPATPGKTLFVMSPQGDHMVSDGDYESLNHCAFWKSLSN